MLRVGLSDNSAFLVEKMSNIDYYGRVDYACKRSDDLSLPESIIKLLKLIIEQIIGIFVPNKRSGSRPKISA